MVKLDSRIVQAHELLKKHTHHFNPWLYIPDGYLRSSSLPKLTHFFLFKAIS